MAVNESKFKCFVSVQAILDKCMLIFTVFSCIVSKFYLIIIYYQYYQLQYYKRNNDYLVLPYLCMFTSPTLGISGNIDRHEHMVKSYQRKANLFECVMPFRIVNRSISNLFLNALIFLV